MNEQLFFYVGVGCFVASCIILFLSNKVLNDTKETLGRAEVLLEIIREELGEDETD